MNSNELRELVKTHFSLVDSPNVEAVEETPITFSEDVLTDGTLITNDSEDDFAEGQTLYIISEEGEKLTAPEGVHSTESGKDITVDAQGMITSVSEKEAEEETPAEEAPVEEEMSSEEVEEVSETKEETFEEEAIEEMDESEEEELEEETASIEEMIAQAFAEVVAPVMEELKEKVAELEKRMEEYSASPAIESAQSRFNKETNTDSNLTPMQAQKEMIRRALINKNK